MLLKSQTATPPAKRVKVDPESTESTSGGARRQSGGGTPFKRVDTEVWGKEVIEGLEDNSCACTNEFR
jgi:hypothetical protein